VTLSVTRVLFLHNPRGLPEFSPIGTIRDGVTGHRDRLLNEAENLDDEKKGMKTIAEQVPPLNVAPSKVPRSYTSRVVKIKDKDGKVPTSPHSSPEQLSVITMNSNFMYVLVWNRGVIKVCQIAHHPATGCV